MANSGKIREVGSDGVTVEAATPASQPGDIFPSGVILHYAGASAPTNWLICDGTAVSRATYAALFAAIGTTYGAGDGSTTFNLPDLRGKTAVGKHTSGTFTTLGASGGEENHTLITSEMPSHSHGGTTQGNTATTDSIGGHSHAMTSLAGMPLICNGPTYGSFTTSTAVGPDHTFNAFDASAVSTGSVGNHSHTVNSHAHAITAEGGGSTHNNMPPYVVLHNIIKT